jgi:hypothetical protein
MQQISSIVMRRMNTLATYYHMVGSGRFDYIILVSRRHLVIVMKMQFL